MLEEYFIASSLLPDLNLHQPPTVITLLRVAMKYLLLAPFILAIAFRAFADEGMWLFNQPPRQLLRERYQFEPTDAWF